jgi:hypothetical protein
MFGYEARIVRRQAEIVILDLTAYRNELRYRSRISKVWFWLRQFREKGIIPVVYI